MNKKTIFSALGLCTMLMCSTARCDALVNMISTLTNVCCIKNYNVEAGLYGGYLNVKSEELVLSSKDNELPEVLSRLDWTANNVWVLGAKLGLLNPKTRFHLTLDGWSKVFAGNGKMEDRDFFNPDFPTSYTDISVHSDTKLKVAFALDLEGGSDFLYSKKNTSCWSLGYLWGAKYTRFDWDAFGGKYNYDDGRYVGELPSSTKVIAYKQEFFIPYLGLQANWKYDSCINFNVFGKYSCVGVIICKDEHLLRNITFTDTFRYAHYWIGGVEAVWNYSECVAATLKYTYDRLNRETGHTNLHSNGKTIGFSDAAGLENTYQMLTVSVAMHF